MAKRGAVELELTADARQLAAEFRRVGKLQDDMLKRTIAFAERSRSAERASVRWLKRMKTGLTGVVRMMGKLKRAVFSLKGLLLATGVGALFYSAIKAASEFEFAMKLVGAVAGATTKELERLTKAAREAGRTTSFSAREAAQAQYYLASAGLKTNQVIKAQTAVIALAIAEAHDLAQTSEFLAATMSAFGLKAEDMARIANVMSAAISNSQATMDKLAFSMRYVAPVASNLGYSVEQTTAALMALYNAGLRGMQAGTGLRMTMVSLINPVGDAAKQLYDLKISVKDIYGNFLTLPRIIDQFRAAMDKATDKTAFFQKLAKIVGAETLPALLILIRQGGDAMREMELKITGTTAAFAKQEAQAATFKMKIKGLASAWGELLITVGNFIVQNPVVLKAIESIRQWVLRLVTYLQKNKGAANEFVAAIMNAFGELARFVWNAVKSIVKSILWLAGSLSAFKKATGVGLKKDIADSVGGITRLQVRIAKLNEQIAGAADSPNRRRGLVSIRNHLLYQLQQVMGTLTKQTKTYGDSAVAQFGRATDAIKKTLNAAGPLLGGGAGGGASIWDRMSAAINQAWKRSPPMAQAARPGGKKGGRKGAGGAAGAADDIGFWDELSNTNIEMWAKVNQLIKQANDDLEKHGDIWAGIRIGLEDVTKGTSNWLQGKDLVIGMARDIGQAFETFVFDMFTNRLKTTSQKFIDFFKSIFNALLKQIIKLMASKMLMMLVKLVSRLFGGGGGAGQGLSESWGGGYGGGGELAGAATTAQGGIYRGGWRPVQAFAGGGVVRRPTIGLVGEGGQNEAVVPLPDGKNIPVKMEGGGKSTVVINIENHGADIGGAEVTSQRTEMGAHQLQKQIFGIMIYGANNNPEIMRAFGTGGRR